jgi:septal ring factor EnvC (AmiA/AmiB activator)
LKHEQISNDNEKAFFELSYLKEVKHITIQGAKKHGYSLLVIAVRFYIQSTNFLREKYKEIKTKIKEKINKNHINGEKKEISKFLKIIGDYKNKIREIKHKIKREENL